MTITLSTTQGLFDVLDGSLCLALEGAPIATLELAADAEPPLGPASLLLADGQDEPIAFVGVLDFARAYQGRVSVSWVGGAGALGGSTAATHYTAIASQVARADVVQAILAAAGEALAPSSVLPTDTLLRWTRVAGETWSKALRRALTDTGYGWRILDSGEVWIGVEEWPAAELGGIELDEDALSRSLFAAYTKATVRPGTALEDGRRVVRVTFYADGGALVELEVDDGSAAALAAVLAPKIEVDPYAKIWPASVVLQRSDGTIDVRLDKGAPLATLERLRYDAGERGARYVLPRDARVRVAFEGARPDGAFAFGAPTAPSASKGVARAGDRIDIGTLSVAIVSGAAVFTYTPPAGSGGIPVAGVPSVQLVGVIVSASEEVFLT